MANYELLTTHKIARALGVDIKTVKNWIDQNKMAGFRTPGGHRRVQKSDFIAFLKKFRMPLPKNF